MLQPTSHACWEGSKFILTHFLLEVRPAASLHHRSWCAGLGPPQPGLPWSASLADSPEGGSPTHRLTLPWPTILIGAFFGTTGSHVHGILYAWESGQKWRTRVKMKPQGLVNPRIFWATKSLLKWVRYSGTVSNLSSTPTLQQSHKETWVDGDQRGSSLVGFCMRDQFIFYFLFLLATSIQISKYLFFFFFYTFLLILCRCFIAKLSAVLFILLEMQDAWFIVKFSKSPIQCLGFKNTCKVKRLELFSKPPTLWSLRFGM